MNKNIFRVFLFLLLFYGLSQAFAQGDVSISFGFRDSLSPYGSWGNYSSCQQCWRPRVSAGFMPYTNGHWIYTSYGPTWVSEEPWGWATDHYGSWTHTSQYGWLWQPGYEWAPARVTWSVGTGYIGWSPYVGASTSNADLWVFIDSNRFFERSYSPYLIRGPRVRDLFSRRTVQMRRSLDRQEIERIVRRPVRLVDVEHTTVRADHKTTKMIVPVTEKTRILQNVNRAAKGAHTGTKTITKTEVKTKTKTVVGKNKSKTVETEKVKVKQSKKQKKKSKH